MANKQFNSKTEGIPHISDSLKWLITTALCAKPYKHTTVSASCKVFVPASNAKLMNTCYVTSRERQCQGHFKKCHLSFLNIVMPSRSVIIVGWALNWLCMYVCNRNHWEDLFNGL